MPTCDVCGSAEFDCSDGLYYCSICSTQSQAVRDEELDHCDAYEARHGGVDARVDRTSKVPTEKKVKNFGRPWRTHEAFQIILKEQAKALIRLGAKPELLDVTFRLWVMYLSKCGIAFANRKDPYITQRSIHSSRDLYPGIISDPRIKPIRTMATAKRKNPDFVPKKIQEHRQLIEATQGETFYEGDTPLLCSTAELDFVKLIETEAKKQEELEAERLKDLVIDYEGLPILPSCSSNVAYNVIERLSMIKVLSVAVVALMYTNSQVTVSDVVRWIKEGRVPYTQAVDLLPADMQFLNKDSTLFIVQDMPTPENVLMFCGRLIDFLQLPEFPIVDMCLLTSRYIIELNLPRELHAVVGNLIERQRPVVRYHCCLKRNIFMPNPSALAMTYIIVALKILFGIDGKKERKLTEFARLPSTAERYSKPLFIWHEWVAYSEQRAAHDQANSYPAEIQDLRRIRDVYTAMNNYDSVIDRHTRHSKHKSKHYREYHQKMISQIHGELKHIYKTQKLPALAAEPGNISSGPCFSNSLQPTLPDFSDCTLQYLTESLQRPGLDFRSSTRSHKRKHREMDTGREPQTPTDMEFNETLPTVIETREDVPVLSRPSSPVTGILANDASTCTTDRTTNERSAYYQAFRDENSRQTALTVLRPCSYQWLLTHCAQHVDMGPGTIEKYIQRLELLHIVPPGQSKPGIRIAFLRRCYRTGPHVVRFKRQKRSRGRPRKLI